MVETHALGLVLHRLAVDDGVLERLEDGLVDGVALRGDVSLGSDRRSCGPEPGGRGCSTYEVFDGAPVGAEDDGLRVVGHLALGLRVDADELQFLPHDLHELVEVPPILGADGHRHRDPVQQVQLLDADGVDLVQHVDDGDVAPALRLQHVDDVVDRRVAPQRNVGRGDLVLLHDGPDLVVVDVGLGDGAGDVEAALLLLLECDVGGRLVDADAEALELRLDDALVGEGLVDVEDDEDEVARLGDGDDLATTAAAVLGAFDDTGEIDDLEGRACGGLGSAVFCECSARVLHQGPCSILSLSDLADASSWLPAGCEQPPPRQDRQGRNRQRFHRHSQPTAQQHQIPSPP